MTQRIDSPSNSRIQAAVKAIASGETMLLEGQRMIDEALAAGVEVEDLFVQKEEEKEEGDFLRRGRQESDARTTRVSPRVLRRLSDLPSTRSVVALAKPPQRTLASLSSLLLSKKSPSSSSLLFLLLDDVQDPANVGAILRSAEAFGVAAAVLTPGCAWPFSPRALRASAGSAFRLPVCARVPAIEVAAWARRHGIPLAGAEAHGGESPETLASVRPLALVIGSEGHGISPEIAAALEHRVTLPLAGRVESLNAAVAAGVLLNLLTRRAKPLR